MKKIFTAALACIFIMLSGCSQTAQQMVKKENLNNNRPNAAQNRKYDTYTGLAPLSPLKADIQKLSEEKGLPSEKIAWIRISAAMII